MLRRREMLAQLGAGATALAVTQTGLIGSAKAAETTLSAVISLNGTELRYLESAGEDLGDFTGDGFVQRCVRVARPETSLTVYFRPDRNSDRVEVVFELGRMWGAANAAAAHLGPYQVTIKRGDNVLASVDVPSHWWFARWRWQSAPRPIVRTYDQLLAAKLLPPYSKGAAEFAKPTNTSKATYEKPMDTAGLAVKVGMAGERYDIGPLTEYQAEYLITGGEAALAALRSQAEAAASMPMHMRDEVTKAPVDFFQYPTLDWYYRPNGKPWVKTVPSDAVSSGVSCPWHLDTSHDPALNYVPYLLTGDPYHLEELQFQGNQLLGFGAYHRTLAKLQIVFPGETRSFAWSMRTMFQLAKVTPVTVPKWLKPRAYWKHIVDDNLTWFTKSYVSQPAAACSVFHAGPRLDTVAAWMEDFIAMILGWAVFMGFEDWRPAYLWKLQATLARTNGKSGWPRQWCAPYYFNIGPKVPAGTLYAATLPANTWYKNWTEAWEAFRADPASKVVEPFKDAESWAQPNDAGYLVYTRGVLAMATHLGVEAASEPFQFVDEMARRKAHMLQKWAIAPASRDPNEHPPSATAP